MTADDSSERAQQSYAALGVGLVCILVGVPLWWKTTEVYRVELPYSDIEQLKKADVSYAVHFTVISFDESITRLQLISLQNNLKKRLKSTVNEEQHLAVIYHGHARDCYEDEKYTLSSSSSFEDVEAGLDQLKLVQENGKYSFVLLPDYAKFTTETDGHVGRKRYTFLNSRTDEEQLAGFIEQVLRQVYVNEAVMLHTWAASHSAVHLQADKESMRAVHSSAKGYDVTFTLLNPQPDQLKVTWDIEHGIQQYLLPFLKSVKQYTPIRVTSQYLHSTGIGVRPEHSEIHGSYILKTDQLPHIINPVEAYLSSHVSNNPNLNFIVFISPPSQTPLQIVDHAGEVVQTSAFMSPRWGGFLVYNTKVDKNTTLPLVEELDMRRIMEVFGAQLRLLLGVVSSQAPSPEIYLAPPTNNLINDWELDLWLRAKCLENLATSTATLNSLAQLLAKIGNIVINDDIGREVEKGVEEIKQSAQLLSQGELRSAFLASRQAILAAEKAFFDPSLLELLYFPEDQKFAIYIPLFLPISIPVVMSTIQALKWLVGKSKVKQE